MFVKKSVTFLFLFLFFLCLSVLSVSAVSDPELIYSESALIYSVDTDEILYGKNINEELYPTSTAKIMTAMLAFEYYGDDLDQTLTCSMEPLSEAAGTSISLQAGEVISVRDLLYAVLIPGANDAACVLAYNIAGNTTAFVNMMNSKAQELGCTDTHYANCTGIHEQNMVTTAADTLRIARYAYNNSNLMAMSSLTSYTIPATNKYNERKIYNRNYMVSTLYYTNYYDANAKGMNAGYTPNGGYCLVTSVRKHGCTYIIVCLKAPVDEETQTVRSYTDAKTLINWASANFDFVNVLEETTMICEIPVTLSGNTDYITLVPQNSVSMFLPKDVDVSTAITKHWILLADSMEAPVREGQIGGILTVKYNDKLVTTVNLVTNSGANRSEFLYILSVIRNILRNELFRLCCLIALVLWILYVFLNAVYMEKKRRNGTRRKRPNLSGKH